MPPLPGYNDKFLKKLKTDKTILETLAQQMSEWGQKFQLDIFLLNTQTIQIQYSHMEHQWEITLLVMMNTYF